MKAFTTLLSLSVILMIMTAWSPTSNNTSLPSVTEISSLGTASVSTGLVSIRELNLKKEVDKKAFEEFVANEYVPTLRRHIPGATAVVVKGDRGGNIGEYLFIYLWDSAEIRNLYFPSATEQTEVWQEIEAASGGAIQRVFDKMATYLEGESYGEFTDYVAIR